MPLLIELQYLAPVQYYAKLCSGHPMLIEQHEHYIKRSYRNRAHILGANGVMRLTIPLKKGKNEGQPIREVQIEYVQKWQQQHWQSIQSAYGKAPFFEHYSDELRPFFEKKYHKPDPHYKSIPYAQVFQDKHGFVPNLSVLDLLFCMGSETSLILERSNA